MPIISKSKRWLWILPYLFLAPWLIGLLVFNAIPILSSLYLSFTNYNFVSSPNWIGLKNYVTMFGKDPQYLQALKVTVTYVLVAVPLELAFALFLALVLNKGIRALGFYRAVYYVPSLIGGSVAIAILWQQVFGERGIVNQVLSLIGIDMPSWVGTPDYAIWSIIFLKVWQFGSPMVIFLAGSSKFRQTIMKLLPWMVQASGVNSIMSHCRSCPLSYCLMPSCRSSVRFKPSRRRILSVTVRVGL